MIWFVCQISTFSENLTGLDHWAIARIVSRLVSSEKTDKLTKNNMQIIYPFLICILGKGSNVRMRVAILALSYGRAGKGPVKVGS